MKRMNTFEKNVDCTRDSDSTMWGKCPGVTLHAERERAVEQNTTSSPGTSVDIYQFVRTLLFLYEVIQR